METKQEETLIPLAIRGNGKLGFSSALKFANTDLELYEMQRKVFRHFIKQTMKYKNEETRLFMQIYDMLINKENIRLYINRHSKEIYLAIINEETDKLPQYTIAL